MVAETANGCLVLHIARTIAERHNREPENLKRLLCALLRSVSGELLPSLQKLPLRGWGKGLTYYCVPV
jgi:hypothetical protein